MGNKRQPIKTTIEEAIAYWRSKADESPLGVDWSEADTRCWRCGYKRDLQRCHIIPHSRGGKDEPSNIVLLCKRCHQEGPNVEDSEIMWDWIKAYAVPGYDTFWRFMGIKEYRFIYNKSVYKELEDILLAANIDPGEEETKKVMKELSSLVYEKASKHFGQPYFNNATMAGLYRMTLKKIASHYGVEFPIKKEEVTRKSWYLEEYIGNDNK